MFCSLAYPLRFECVSEQGFNVNLYRSTTTNDLICVKRGVFRMEGRQVLFVPLFFKVGNTLIDSPVRAPGFAAFEVDKQHRALRRVLRRIVRSLCQRLDCLPDA